MSYKTPQAKVDAINRVKGKVGITSIMSQGIENPMEITGDFDPRISKIFYYFQEHTGVVNGRTVGRKIGVVQEIIVRKLLLQSEKLRDSIVFEPFLPGISGASHKVEFVFYQPTTVVDLDVGYMYQFGEIQIGLEAVAPGIAKVIFCKGGAKKRMRVMLHTMVARRHIPALDISESVGIKISGITPESARFVFLDLADVRASVESKRVGAQRFAGSDKLGSGIQSIEKAKQAALVAIDADLLFNKTTRAIPDQAAEGRKYVSIVVLGNGVHWTEKDKSILRTYVDFTYLVPDKSIIRYAEYIRSLSVASGKDFFPFFMSYFEGMTKTAPDGFDVDDNDFEIICPEEETRSMMRVLEDQIDSYRLTMVLPIQ